MSTTSMSIHGFTDGLWFFYAFAIIFYTFLHIIHMTKKKNDNDNDDVMTTEGLLEQTASASRAALQYVRKLCVCACVLFGFLFGSRTRPPL
jgi:hypothetical protein